MKLYHYIHCPFCIRVRMACGCLGIAFESTPLPYQDEQTPIDLCGKKMLPIIVSPDGKAQNESLNIIKSLDKNNRLQLQLLDDKQKRDELEEYLNQIGSPIHSLCMPYWAWTKEFDTISREYFQKKKEVKRGPFHLLIQGKETHLKRLEPLLKQLESKLSPFYQSESLTIFDLMLASHLWGMYVFPEFQFSTKIHNYLQEVAAQTKFVYHEDFWREP